MVKKISELSEQDVNTTVNFNDGSSLVGTIESAVKCGLFSLLHTPTGDSDAIVLGQMNKATAVLTAGDMRTAGALNNSHLVASYSWIDVQGDGDWSQMFVNEAKWKNTNTGTGNSFSFYKCAVDTLAGTCTNVYGLDMNMALTGLTNTNAYVVYAPQSNWDIEIGGRIKIGKDIDFDATVAGSSGNQTINKSAGRVTFAIGAGTTPITVTNSLVTANSIIVLTMATLDATAIIPFVNAGAGSFTVTMNANATAATDVNFLVVN